MVIRFDANMNKPGDAGRFTPAKVRTADAKIDTTDAVVKSETPEKIFQKPVVSKKPNLAEGSLKRSLSAAGNAASSASGAAAGAALGTQMDALANSNVKFFEERGFSIPLFMGKNKEISAKSAAKIITGGKREEASKLKLQMGGNAILPLQDADDVKEAMVFKGLEKPSAIKNDSAAEFLKDSESAGLKLKTADGENVGAYGAYNYLTTGWEREGHGTKPVDVVRDGVAIMTLTPEKMKNVFDVQVEFKNAWKAYNAMQAHGAEALSEVAKPVNDTPFTKRAEIYDKLDKDHSNKDHVKIFYSVIANSTGKNEDFEQAADYFLDIRKRTQGGNLGPMDALKAFNYARANLKGKPILEKAFVELLTGTSDINAAVGSLQLATQPVKNESFNDRLEAMTTLNRHFGRSTPENYVLVRDELLPDESIKDGCKEFAEMYKEVRDSNHGGYSQARRDTPRVFRYLRNELKDQPEKRDSFKKLYMSSGNFATASRMMRRLEDPVGDSKFAQRAHIMAGMAKHLNESRVEDEYNFIRASCKEGDSFSELGKRHVRILDTQEMYHHSSGDARNAFRFTRNELKDDKPKVDSFIRILDRKKDTSETISVYNAIQSPVAGEEYPMRERSALKLLTFKDESDARYYMNFAKDYNAIRENIFPGETLEEVTDQFIAIRDAGVNNHQTGKARKAFVEIKQDAKNDKAGFKQYIEILKVLKDTESAAAAAKMLKKPVGGESYEDRVAIFKQLGSEHTGEDGFAKDTVADYETLVGKKDDNETLSQAARRFKILSNTLLGRERPDDVRQAFTFIHDEMEKGVFKDKKVDEVTADLVKALLINDNLEEAENYLVNQQKPEEEHKIEEGDGYVIIGGVKLPVSGG